MDINFIVTIEEANVIMNALQNAPLPLVQSSPLVQKLESQARAQLQPPPMPQENDEEAE